jgi:outer membrane protein assembly factor BamB
MLDSCTFPRVHGRESTRHRLAAGILVGAVASVAGWVPAGAQGAPSTPSGGWTQFQADAGHDGVATTGPAPPYAKAWSFPVAPETTGKRSIGLSAPVIDGSTVIAVGATAVYGVNLDSGQQEWTMPRQGPPAVPAVAETGGRSILLFTDATADGSAELRAIDLRTRKDAWDAPLPLKSVSRSGVTVAGRTAFVGDADGNVYAVDVATGEATWTVSVGGEAKGPLPVADGKVFAVPLSHTFRTSVPASVVALDASTGEEVWRYAPQPATPFTSLPAVAGGSVVVVAPQTIADARLLTLSESDGSLEESVRINSIVFYFVAPASGEDATYAIDANGGLHAVALGAPTQTWQFQFNERVLRTSPVIVGDHVLVGLGDGTIGAVKRSTGHLVWRSDHLPGVVGSMAVSPAELVATVGGNHGGLVAFRHDDAGTLIDEVSPTVPRWGAILASFAIAFFAVGLVIAVPLTIVARRTGAPKVEEEHEADAGEEDGVATGPDDGPEDEDEP